MSKEGISISHFNVIGEDLMLKFPKFYVSLKWVFIDS